MSLSENGRKHAGMAPIRSGCRKTCAQSGSRGIDRPNHPVVAGVQLKALLRKKAVRTFDAVSTAIGDICDLFDARQCRNFFSAAGYEPD